MEYFMNKETFLSIKEELENFRKTLSDDIKKDFISSGNDCYLVEATWYNKLYESFKKFNGSIINKALLDIFSLYSIINLLLPE